MLSEHAILEQELRFEGLERDKCIFLTHRNTHLVGMHTHAFLELSYIANGHVEHTLDGKTDILSAGDYILVDYGSAHCYSGCQGSGFDNYDCIFLPDLLDPALKGTKNLRIVLEHYLLHFNMQTLVKNPAKMVFHDDDGRVLRLIECIGEELERREAGYTELVRCYLLEILLITMRKIEGVQSASVGHEISTFLTAYVAEHYAEEMVLGDIARQMNYCLPYVSQRFKEDMGVGFARYVQNYRVMRACRLLSESRMTFEEITVAVGYRDVKTFSRLIKKHTGLSPLQFRRQHRGSI